MAYTTETTKTDRLQKIMAHAGIASRRKCEDLIREGQVTINGRIATLGQSADPTKDAIKVNGKLLQLNQVSQVYFALHKPRQVLAVLSGDNEGRPTLDPYIKKLKFRVFPIGRMEFNGEGLLLLTNDGMMAQKIAKSPHIPRLYHVKVSQHVNQTLLEKISRPMRIEGQWVHPKHVAIKSSYAAKTLLEIVFEGMEEVDVRLFVERRGMKVERLIRAGIGHIKLERLKPGELKAIKKSSFTTLLEQPELLFSELTSRDEKH